MESILQVKKKTYDRASTEVNRVYVGGEFTVMAQLGHMALRGDTQQIKQLFKHTLD